MRPPLEPAFKPCFPPRYVTPAPGTPVISRPYPGLTMTPMHVFLRARGLPNLAVVVYATRQSFAWRMAVRWARKKAYGDRGNFEITLSHVAHDTSD